MSKAKSTQTKSNPMGVTAAVEQAKLDLAKLFPEFAQQDLRLEEVETPQEAERWRITFSSAVPNEVPGTNPLADLLRATRPRKMVELAAESGDLLSVKAA